MKRCSTLLVLREMLIETTVRYRYTPIRMARVKETDHYTPVRMARVKETDRTKCW